MGRYVERPGLATGPEGAVFVTDPALHQVYRWTDDGLEVIAGSGETGSRDDYGPRATFVSPQGVAVDDSGAVVVADTAANTIRRFADGKVSTVIRARPGGYVDGDLSKAQFNYPWSIALAGDGAVFVADWHNRRVRRIADGRVTTIAGSGERGRYEGDVLAAQFASPWGIAVAPDNSIYVTDGLSGRVVIVRDGRASSLNVTGPGTPLVAPEALAIDADGVVYLADIATHRVLVVRDGRTQMVAGNGTPGLRNGNVAEAQFRQPAEVALDKQGRIYVADAGNHVIRRIHDGRVVTLAGTGEPGFADGQLDEAQFELPTGIDVDGDGAVWLADTGNHCIRRIKDGLVETMAGTRQPGFADGAALSAAFNQPTDVEVAENGDVFIADAGNHRVRVLRQGKVLSVF